VRFLTSIIKRTFEDTCFECSGELEIWDIQNIKINKRTFLEDVINASRKGADDFGITILCVHTDADDRTDTNVYRNKIAPALDALENCNDDICKNVVFIVPIQMTESWMLADKDLFKKVIGGTNKNDNELGIYKAPEEYAKPKEVIENAIKTANRERTKRHRKDLSISDLYLQIGQSISIEKLKTVPSYVKFQNNIRETLKKLNYLY
jgi:hypothetical protein